jgi:hypothetical protein
VTIGRYWPLTPAAPRCDSERIELNEQLLWQRLVKKMTIGELRDELDGWPESLEIIFECPELEFYRLTKRRGDRLQLEFKQTIYKDAKTGNWHVEE